MISDIEILRFYIFFLIFLNNLFSSNFILERCNVWNYTVPHIAAWTIKLNKEQNMYGVYFSLIHLNWQRFSASLVIQINVQAILLSSTVDFSFFMTPHG